jgi:hypothetical protein
MNTELQGVEIETVLRRDNNFAVEGAARGQSRSQRIQKLGEIAIQRFRVAALQQYLIAIAKNKRAKTVPLRLVNPRSLDRQFTHSFSEHRQDRRVYRKLQASW